jgi:hypothetical protein|tara:strand:- start:359 stop:1006 length:648 start_codon:yes stop_codon:yes gene_type:complete
MITVPQLEVYKIISGFFEMIKKNESLHANAPEKTFLYRTFNGLDVADLDYYVQAKDLFTRTRAHPKNFDVRMMFDKDRANLPTMHITMGEDKSDVLGIGMSRQLSADGQSLEHTQIDSFMVNIIFTSDNKNEITLMYELLKSFLPALQICFEANGLLNVKRHGRDLTIEQSEVPTHIYMRLMTLSGQYESTSPAMEELLTIASAINAEAKITEIC